MLGTREGMSLRQRRYGPIDRLGLDASRGPRGSCGYPWLEAVSPWRPSGASTERMADPLLAVEEVEVDHEKEEDPHVELGQSGKLNRVKLAVPESCSMEDHEKRLSFIEND
ncbi:hypothetical protein PDE_00547 [Penicillium oxalicum 114-2]|uniref:Uncharacterized protein n=1 Tax=Penicillium oxalicum (strain 114-2 / CGMCC 5302) TaxID=933388 RepID=S8AIM0_PENO1|nr:hypothetical protein PDE_00547 [Penicillium oxalicum 114-2]